MSMDMVVREDPEKSLNLLKVAQGLFKSGLFPNAKNEYGAFSIIQYGRELGIPPMMSLKNINIISGQLACNAQLMLTLALHKGVTYEVMQEGDKGAKIIFKRGSVTYEASFCEEDAKAAGLLGKDNWRKYPRDMYFWRAVAKGVRRVAPDAVMGLYTAEEITEGAVITVTDIPSASPKESNVVNPAPPNDTFDADPDDAPPFEPDAPKLITDPQRKRLYAIAKKAGWSDEDIKAYFAEKWGIGSSKEIPASIYEEVCAWLESHTGYNSKKVNEAQNE